MKITLKRIVSFFCVLCLLISGWEGLFPLASGERALAAPEDDAAESHNPKVSMSAGEYSAADGTVSYTVVVEAEGDMDYTVTTEEGGVSTAVEKAYPVVLEDRTAGADPDLEFISGSFTYAHREGFALGDGPESRVNDAEVTSGTTDFAGFPLTVDHMYDGDTLTLTYLARVVGAEFDKDSGTAIAENEAVITNCIGDEQNAANDTADDRASANVSFAYTPLTKSLTDREGSWATWTVEVNPGSLRLNGGQALTLKDSFTQNQSIDYASIRATGGVTYDYRGTTGTFVIPDNTAAQISYRTRIVAQPGEIVDFGNTAVLFKGPEEELQTVRTEERHTIYPSASDVASTTGIYMVRFYVYGDGNMQTGIEGAKFILLDENRRPITYKSGSNAGETVSFLTDSTGYANVGLDEEPGDVSIEKNTRYYLEMIQAPDNYMIDNSLYGFLINDHPNYALYEYFNGDTLKVRLYPEEASLRVSMRFSGNYDLTQEQMNDINVILQKKNGDDWESIESHSYSEFSYGSLTFDTGKAENAFEYGETYRVIQENQLPWDLPDSVYHTSAYYLMIGSGEYLEEDAPEVFTVTDFNQNRSFNVVIDNEYEEHMLTVTKMDKEDGTKLAGAVFTVKKAKDDSAIKTYTSDADGVINISGGADYESETLYYVVETQAPEGYLLPVTPEKTYFYFCNDPYLIQTILEDLPEGKTAVNLTETYDSLTLDNQRAVRSIPVMKTWQGNAWPAGVYSVVLGLYRSVNGAEPTAVPDELGNPRAVTLTAPAPYNNNAFTNLPAREGDDTITYSIREEHVYAAGSDSEDILNSYVQEYGVSDAGVYIVRNSPATTLTVSKEWYGPDDVKVTDEAVLAEQSEVTFDIYRSTAGMPEELTADGILTNAEMEAFTAGLTKVRSGVRFGASEGWTRTVYDLAKRSDLDELYYYYALETVPSFGTEIYEVNETDGTVLIRNRTAPDTVSVTVEKAALVNDPRPEAVDTEFGFTLALNAGTHPIRSYPVAEGYVTDWNGEVTFALKPEESIALTLPVGVTAAVTEAVNPEYVEVAASDDLTELDSEGDRVFRFDVTADADGKSITFTNTLRVICKVVDDHGMTKPFESLKSALAYVRENPDSFTGETVTIYMLEDYVIPATDVFAVQEGENITLTTASTGDAEFPFETDRTEDTDTAIITRGAVGGSMLTNEGTLTLGKIILDGAKDSFTATGDGGLVSSSGMLKLSGDTTLRDSAASGRGGAIYSTGTIQMPGGSITGSVAPSGSAIYLDNGTLNMGGGEIVSNTGAEDGAVVVSGTECRINLSGSPVIFDNNISGSEQANIGLGVDSDYVITVVAPGLAPEARIGVRAMESHREIGEQFATAEYGMTENLNCFINDAYEYRGKLKDGTATNIVWDGLTLTLKKELDALGANPNDTFTITLTSSSIRRNNYTIDGNLDNTIVAARGSMPGTIVLKNVRVNDQISISPLPLGSFTITEAASNYAPIYSGTNTETDTAVSFENGTFLLEGNSTITVTNIRRLAQVVLTKILQDQLEAEGETQDCDFTLKLTEADGSPVAGFQLAEGVTTGTDGEAAISLSPSNTAYAEMTFRAPVGAFMTVTETPDPDYRITASALTRPAEGTAEPIPDEDAGNDNVFAFTVTDDGADVTFSNERKIAVIELRKELVGKVSATESFSFTVTLIREDAAPAAGYTMYQDPEDPSRSITTDAQGKAVISLGFPENTDSRSLDLIIPEGTKLTVAETVVTKNVGGTEREIYDTRYSVNGGTAVTGSSLTINSVSDSDESIVFTNTRKTRTVTVTNTIGGYSGNIVPFAFTATVTDGGEGQDDYDANGFTDGQQTFELTTGQSKVLTVPYGAELTVEESFVVGYETLVKHGSGAAVVKTSDVFAVTDNVTVAFTNNQLINLVLVNNTSSTLENVRVYTAYGTKMYRVNDAQDGQDPVSVDNHWATVSIDPGKTAILEVNHQNSVTYEQAYTVSGDGPAEGYYYTIKNEPSFHEFADPAILRFYDTASFEVKGKLRYSVADSTVTFTEQPLVSFDANGGSWTTEMDGYRDRDGDRKVYQLAVDKGEAVSRPQPDPVYPAAGGIQLLGWTQDREYAEADHADGAVDSAKLYDFGATVTEPVELYAIWSRGSARTVTVKNAVTAELTVTVTLENTSPLEGVPLTDAVVTDANGQASFSLPAGEYRNLNVPEGAKLLLEASGADCIAYSSDYDDADSAAARFAVSAVDHDGTVTFIAGICKITDSTGNILYNADGQPAVYASLADAFTAYNGTLYTDASHTAAAQQAAVKMLVDEYAVGSKLAFPTKDAVITTAGTDDADFPYVGSRERAALCRAAGFTSDSLFTLQGSAREITLRDIILDGQNIAVANQCLGGLIHIDNAGAVLNIESGTTLRNTAFASYTNAGGSWGGAIYLKTGTLNVRAGLFSNLHARRGGAICAVGGTLNVTGSNGSTRFENCTTNGDNNNSNGGDGGAIDYMASNPLTIDGGNDRENPGILFVGCVAGSNWGDGGAIYAETNKSATVSVSGCAFIECSARNSQNTSTSGDGGGAINARNVKSLEVSHCAFSACDSLNGGGAIASYVKTNDAGVSIADCSFDHCSCKAQGGALAIYQDNNGATASTTKLLIENSDFSDCSSGTQNSSGGAIQCYLPRMEFVGTSFSDCWAGKEGGAVNHFFGSNYAQVWANSELSITDCRFIRCRAEDRYDTTALQHYGGGVNSKVQTVVVTGSYFEDCVSTLREGGALHLGGEGNNSSATILNSTFKSCLAKEEGGAVLASTAALTISNSRFYGCSSLAESGGAVSHYRNSREDSTQNTTTITGCVFSADPDDSGSESCSAAKDGGAVWTRAKTVSIEDCTIEGCTAGSSGGGVYLKKLSSQSAVISGGAISGSQAVSGSAVYVEDRANFAGAAITGNTCSNINSAAIHGGTLYFEGNVTVEDNHCSADSDYNHDVLMQNNNVTTIYTTSAGLGEDAHIGVYVPDSQFTNRGTEGKAFGTWNKEGDLLDSFFNDRDDGLFGYQNSSTDNKIYWGFYLCKITDAEGNTLQRPNGRDAVYQRLTMAFDEFESIPGAVYVKMLVENYNIQQTAQISNFPGADLTLTTAGIDDEQYPYRGTAGTVCTISRTNSTNQLFYLNNAAATFRLEDITLDGRRDKTADKGDFRMIQAAAGQVVISGGTTFRYGFTSSSGGAIYISNAAAGLEIHSAEGKDVLFDHCTQQNDTEQKTHGGGAIYAKSSVTIDGTDGGKTSFLDCSARRGGAIMVDVDSASVHLSVSNAEFKNCSAIIVGGAVYNGNTNNTTASTTITDCSFENCSTGDSPYSYGGAVNAKTAYLTVDTCTFRDCSSVLNGGAVNHGSETPNRVKTTILNTSFENCKNTGTDDTAAYGGTVYTQARTVELTGCSFLNSESGSSGGALYCQSDAADSSATISGSSFQNCAVTRSGSGGAVYARSRTLTLQDEDDSATVINACKAPDYSGAVYMETSGSTLNISGNTVVSACCADKGGAIYLRSGVTLNLTDSPEFMRNGYTTGGESASEGACFYLAEGSRINLSGSPKFSRNNITNVPRITNGATLDYVRQDLYLAGYASSDATSIHVEGELTGDTIWVWPEKGLHQHHNNQFATTEAGISGASLDKFRNALADETTLCTNGEYLAGVRLPGQANTNVYWDKMYSISFRKIDNKGVTVPGAKFTLYADNGFTVPYATETSADGETDTDAQGNLLAKGMVDFPSIPIGIYYMKETQVPESFRENDTVYLVLVGTPSLRPEDSPELWHNGGPLDVPNAKNLIDRLTTNAGKYFGIFPLKADGKADLSRNLASANAGIVNVRSDYEAWFKKADGSGAALPGAAFTIYVQAVDTNGVGRTYANGYPILIPWSRDGENYPDPVKSADGTGSFRKLDGSIVPKGMVYFRELPIGTFYLVETTYPERNGSNRITFFVEEDRVFRLEVRGTEGNVLSQWQPDGSYAPVEKTGGDYVVGNLEAVCKLTDNNNHLLYELGHDGETLLPAIYHTLEEGFAAAQTRTLYTAAGAPVLADAALKLKALKDLSLNAPVIYTGTHPLTLTTAEKTATAGDRYVFSTTRTSDTARAEIKRNYSADTASDAAFGALITVSGGSGLTLQNIKLNGQKASFHGRAIHVTEGSTLKILNNTQIQDFRQEAAADAPGASDIRGGAILMDDFTTLTVDGGASSRSAVFTNNEVKNNRSGGSTGADGGAIALGKGCTVSLSNAQFTGNRATAAASENGDGGAVSLNDTREAGTPAELTLTNVVFRNNYAGFRGGALRISEKVHLTAVNSIFQNNTANTGSGGAIAALSEENAASELTITGGSFTGNRAAGGGAVMIGGYGTLKLQGSLSMSGNHAAEGSAILASDYAAVRITGGSITGNVASGVRGGAVNVGGSNARVWLSGGPTLFGNLNGSEQRNLVLSDDTNEVIRTTSDGLTRQAKIGVYVIDGTGGELYRKHGLSGKPFGTFENSSFLENFVNDRDLSLYGVRNEKDDTDPVIYWVSNGVSVAFKKVDSFGAGLAGATFVLYTDPDCTQAYEKSPGEALEAVSADGTTLKEGIVLFEEIPEEVYYLRETAVPDDTYADNTGTYIVLVGSGSLTRPAEASGTIWAADGVLSGITQDMIDAQTAQYTADMTDYHLTEAAQYAIFRINDSGKAAPAPDIAAFGILNQPKAKRKVILKKASQNYQPLTGAQFRMFRADLSEVTEGQGAGGCYESGTAGTYFSGRLPYGLYYILETQAPSGYGGNAGKVFVLRVDAGGKSLSEAASDDARAVKLRALLTP